MSTFGSRINTTPSGNIKDLGVQINGGVGAE
jgi:hypothetical protein